MNQKINDKRNINGILLVNKPQNLTSNAVLQHVKRLFRAKKAGHTGSLDPLATGMLPVCFGEATKVSQYFLDADKCYTTTGLLGIKTNTADATGDIIAQVDDVNISNQQLCDVIAEFSGDIKQTPSMFSALKHHGKPLYKYAREGIDIERNARDITIHDIQLNRFDGRCFELTVTCSKGTYIRNLVEDIGDHLGVGAHVTQLHRNYTAGLAEYPMYTLDELNHHTPESLLQYLIPMDKAVEHFPKMILSDHDVADLRLGRTISTIQSNDATDSFRLYDQAGLFIGLGEWHGIHLLKPKRLICY